MTINRFEGRVGLHSGEAGIRPLRPWSRNGTMGRGRWWPAGWAAAVLGWSMAGCLALDWPHYRGPRYDGISTESVPGAGWSAQGPAVAWKASVGIGFAAVSVSGDRVYTTGNQNDTDTVYCLDARTGTVQWKHSYPCPLDPKYYEGGTLATPTVDGDRVYTVSKQGQVYCLNAATGAVVWKADLMKDFGLERLTWGFSGSVLIQDRRAIINAGNAGLALGTADGRALWKSGAGAGGYSTPVPAAFSGQACAVLFGFRDVMAVRIEDGREVWRHPWKTRYDVNAADPIVWGNEVFIASGYDRGCALLDVSGKEPRVVWESKVIRSQVSGAVLIDGHLYGMDGNAGDEKGALKCVEWKSGRSVWSLPMVNGALLAADGQLFALGGKGELIWVAAKPQGPEIRARAQVLQGKCWTMPVLANGRLYCRNTPGDLVCLTLR